MSNVLEDDGFIVSQDDEIFGPRAGGNGFLASADSASTTNTISGGAGVFTVQASSSESPAQNGFSANGGGLVGAAGSGPLLNFSGGVQQQQNPPGSAGLFSTTTVIHSSPNSSNPAASMGSAQPSVRSGLNTSAPAFIPGSGVASSPTTTNSTTSNGIPQVYRLSHQHPHQANHHSNNSPNHHNNNTSAALQMPQMTVNGNPAPISVQRVVQPDGSKSVMLHQGTLPGTSTPDFGEGADGNLLVIDPMSRKIEIPRKSIMLSKAILREGIPSLCMLFMENRCRQGSECNQVHADPNLVLKIRQEAASLPTCCQHHGDVNKHMFEKHPDWENRSILIDGVVIPIQFAAYTQGLERSMTLTNYNPQPNGDMGVTVSVSPTFVCRLQAGGHCRYSDECKFVHLCREVTAQHLSHCVIPLSSDVEKKHKQFSTVKLGVPSSALGGVPAGQQSQQQASNEGSFTVSSSTPTTTTSLPRQFGGGGRGRGSGGSRGAPPAYIPSAPIQQPQQVVVQRQQQPAAVSQPQPTFIVVQGGGSAAQQANPSSSQEASIAQTETSTNAAGSPTAAAAAAPASTPQKPSVITVNTNGGANISPELLTQIAQMVSANGGSAGGAQQIIIQQQ